MNSRWQVNVSCCRRQAGGEGKAVGEYRQVGKKRQNVGGEESCHHACVG